MEDYQTHFISGVSKLWPASQIQHQPAASPCFCKQKYWNTAMLIVYIWCMAAFMSQWQNSAVTTETGPQSLKYLLSGPLQKKCANPCSEVKRDLNLANFWGSLVLGAGPNALHLLLP